MQHIPRNYFDDNRDQRKITPAQDRRRSSTGCLEIHLRSTSQNIYIVLPVGFSAEGVPDPK